MRGPKDSQHTTHASAPPSSLPPGELPSCDGTAWPRGRLELLCGLCDSAFLPFCPWPELLPLWPLVLGVAILKGSIESVSLQLLLHQREKVTDSRAQSLLWGSWTVLLNLKIQSLEMGVLMVSNAFNCPRHPRCLLICLLSYKNNLKH